MQYQELTRLDVQITIQVSIAMILHKYVGKNNTLDGMYINCVFEFQSASNPDKCRHVLTKLVWQNDLVQQLHVH